MSVQAWVPLLHTPPEHSAASQASPELLEQTQHAGWQSVSALEQAAPAGPLPVSVVGGFGQPSATCSVAWVVGGGAGQKLALAVSEHALVPLAQRPPAHSDASQAWPLLSPQSQQEGSQSVSAWEQTAPAAPVPVMVEGVGQPYET